MANDPIIVRVDRDKKKVSWYAWEMTFRCTLERYANDDDVSNVRHRAMASAWYSIGIKSAVPQEQAVLLFVEIYCNNMRERDEIAERFRKKVEGALNSE